MARRSFTIRRGSAEGGSYLQYHAGGIGASLGGPQNFTGSSSATYIKGDNVQTAPVLSTSIESGYSLSYSAFL